MQNNDTNEKWVIFLDSLDKKIKELDETSQNTKLPHRTCNSIVYK